MTKTLRIWFAALAFAVLQSCSVNTETTYYKDSATSMKSDILLDKSMLNMMSAFQSGTASSRTPDLTKLPEQWKSLYDIQKDGKVILNPDSSQVLKKMFLKLNKSNGEIYGLSVKYDKLLPKELTSLLSQSRQLRSLPMQDIGKWDGKSLTIDTEKLNMGTFLTEISKMEKEDAKAGKPKTKSDSIEAYGREMAQNMAGMMRLFNMNFSSTLKFQKPIKTITGKHDFVKQIDNKTIQINVRTNDLLDEKNTLKDKDKKIVITTE